MAFILTACLTTQKTDTSNPHTALPRRLRPSRSRRKFLKSEQCGCAEWSASERRNEKNRSILVHYYKSSATRFDEISPLCRKFKIFGNFLRGYLGFSKILKLLQTTKFMVLG